jgi:ABC-type branched-subunit amino acid transport system substrate-binding protein
MHVIADYAHSLGAHSVGVIWDDHYHFGTEGHTAFVNEAQRAGMSVVEDEEVDSTNADWSTAASSFVSGCSGSSEFSKCDFVAVVLEPAPALSFVQAGGFGNGSSHPLHGIGVPQPLFYTPFVQDCGAPCNAPLVAFTSFNPPIQPYANTAVANYVSEMHSEPSTDIANPEVEGAYQGMLLLWQALKALGPAPSRAALQQVLNSSTLNTGLAPSGSFASGNHFAAVSAQGLQAVYNGNSFTGWRYSTGWLTDHNVSQN